MTWLDPQQRISIEDIRVELEKLIPIISSQKKIQNNQIDYAKPYVTLQMRGPITVQQVISKKDKK